MYNIKVRAFTGASIKSYIPSLAKLIAESSKSNPEEEVQRLKKFAQVKDAIAVVVFDGPKIVGASIGLPLEEESSHFIKPFLEQKLDPADYFHFHEILLSKKYQNRGLGHHFFDLRETHAKHLKRFKAISLAHTYHPRKSKEIVTQEQFWKKRGFIECPDLKHTLDNNHETTFWVKEL